jgi:hypothetical protein
MAQLNNLPAKYGDLTPISFKPRCETYEEWSEIGRTLRRVHNSVLWWVGDWLLYGQRKWGESYAQAIQETDYSYDHLRRVYAVSKSFPPELRRDTLSWSHHREVMYLDNTNKQKWLDKAEECEWSSIRLRDELFAQKIETREQFIDRTTASEVEQQAIEAAKVLTKKEQITEEFRATRIAWKSKMVYFPKKRLEEIESMLANKVDTIWMRSDTDKIMRLIGQSSEID